MGILRKLPAGFGVKAEAVFKDSAARAAMELPGTAAASNPPDDAARNCRRSIEESLGTESLERNLMRVTSANAAQTDTLVLRHYTTV